MPYHFGSFYNSLLKEQGKQLLLFSHLKERGGKNRPETDY